MTTVNNDPLPPRAAIPAARLSRSLSHSSPGPSSPRDGALDDILPVPIPGYGLTPMDSSRNFIPLVDLPPPVHHVSPTPPRIPSPPRTTHTPRRATYAPTAYSRLKIHIRALAWWIPTKGYRAARFVYNLPENIVRGYRRLDKPKPVHTSPPPPPPAPLPAPANAANSPGTPSHTLSNWLLKSSHGYMLGFVITAGLNAGFALWIYYHVSVYLHPHEWRDRPGVTDTATAFTTFTGTELWISIMLCLFNFPGAIFLMVGTMSFIDSFDRHLRISKTVRRIYKGSGTADDDTSDTSPMSWLVRRKLTKREEKLFARVFFALMLVLAAWPLVASLATPPRSRVYAYPKQCGGWDFRVVLDGRVNADVLAKGRVDVYDVRRDSRVAGFETTDPVNASAKRTPGTVVLRRTAPLESPFGGVYVRSVRFEFPYMRSRWESGGWSSNADVGREVGGNYSAEVVDTFANVSRVVGGEFPYLRDDDGLRIDGLALVPDVRRSWRTKVDDEGDCIWGPDARLLENRDVLARDGVMGDVVMQTGMTKFGRCGELTVCANRRKGGNDDEGREMTEMLVVPLGLLLVEQIRWSSCCGDGWQPTYYAEG
ncbi:hypothetical protein Dda_5401 [Drechslerella dactyloides]|uniref:Uncharacterized protein n=1 Tax=Drechslerella dactyloides TaxID=74499 RepID=A0AAD6IWG6_DREDA|nr:hypothetical protein Dda_5401 [Drechslerella dactyloides]